MFYVVPIVLASQLVEVALLPEHQLHIHRHGNRVMSKNGWSVPTNIVWAPLFVCGLPLTYKNVLIFAFPWRKAPHGDHAMRAQQCQLGGRCLEFIVVQIQDSQPFIRHVGRQFSHLVSCQIKNLDRERNPSFSQLTQLVITEVEFDDAVIKWRNVAQSQAREVDDPVTGSFDTEDGLLSNFRNACPAD